MNKIDQDEDFERTARRRAGLKMGWFIHATVFVLVNLFLFAVATLGERTWAPSYGWVFGLVFHGAVVYLMTGGGGLHQRLLEQERKRLVNQRDAW